MTNFRSYDRSQRMLLPPDLKDWVADDDLAHFIVEAVERVDMRAFHVSRTGSGKAQYHPRMMLGLLVYCYASGIFSSRKIEQSSYRNVSVRFIAANSHPDHDTIAKFRRDNAAAFRIAFTQILLLAREVNILKVGMVSIDGTKIDANASKIKSLRYDRIEALRTKLDADIADLMTQAEAADQADRPDGLSLPDEIARRQNLKDKLDAAAKRLEEAARDGDDDLPPPRPDKQTNLTDPDSAIMRKSARHEYRQAYNAQVVVDADGSALILGTNVLQTSNDRQDMDALVAEVCDTVGTPDTLLADAGYAGEKIVKALVAREIEPLIAIARQQAPRPYDFRPPKKVNKPPPKVTAPWRQAMQEKLQTDEAKQKYRKRKQTVEPVFGIIKSVLGFTRFHLRGIENVQNEWTLMALAHNCKRLSGLAA